MDLRENVLHAVSKLAPRGMRAQNSQELAQLLGARALMIFIPDPELGTPIPALGYPQTLPDGTRWSVFLKRCSESHPETARLLNPYSRHSDEEVDVYGIRDPGGMTLVLIGGSPQFSSLRYAQQLLPLLHALFLEEWNGLQHQAIALTMQQTANQAQSLTKEVDTARKKAQDALITSHQSLQVREEFLSIASHELKTPITALLLEVDLVQRLTSGTPFAMRSEYAMLGLQNIANQAKQLSDLVSNLLDVSRFGSCKIPLKRSELNLTDLTKQIVNGFLETARTQGSTLSYEGFQTVTVHADKTRIIQAISNLISNAIKYGQGNPILVTVNQTPQQVIIQVKDQGLGIRPEDQQRIFNRFERAVSGRSLSGLGLGLYITREITEAHQGSVMVESQPKQGSIFTLILPRSHTQAEYEVASA